MNISKLFPLIVVAGIVVGCHRDPPPRYPYTIVLWGKEEWASSAKTDQVFYHETRVTVCDEFKKKYRLILVNLNDEAALHSSGVLVLKDPISVTGDHIYQFSLYQ